MAKLTEKQKQFLQKHNMWNPDKGKSKLGVFEEGDFKDFFRRKEAVEVDLRRLPDGDTKDDLTKQLQAAEEKAKVKKFTAAYKDLEQVKAEARKAANSYVNSLSTGDLEQEIQDWKVEGEALSKSVDQAVSGKKAAKDELANLGKPAPFASGALADQFLQGLQTAELRLHSQISEVRDACNKVDEYLGQNDAGAKLQDFGHQISMLRKEKNVDTGELDLRVESAHVLFIHNGKTLAVGEIQSGVEQLSSEIDKTLEERKKQAQVFANQVYWKERSVTVGDQMLNVLKTGPVERSRIEALWGMASDRAEKGGDADLAVAVKLLADLKSLLDTALPEVKGPVGGVEVTGKALVEARKLQAAQVVLVNTVQTAKAALERLRLEFQPALPTALNVQALKLDGLCAPSTETDPVKVWNAAQSVAAETLVLNELAVAPRTERAAWKQDLAAFELQLAALTIHRQKGETTTVKPLIDKITEDLGKAKLDAAAMKWTEASTAVKLLAPRCEAAIQTADGLAHYEAIYLERKGRVNTLPNPGSVTHDQPKKAVEAVNKLLADAGTEKTTGKYPAAVALLNQIPAAVERARALVDAAKNYDYVIPSYVAYVTELKNFAGDAKEAIKTGLKAFEEAVEAAKIAQTNDYAVSTMLLSRTYGQYSSLKAVALQAKEYADALREFETRFKVVEDHEGRIAIEEFYARMKNDRNFADTHKKAGELHVGTKILNESKALHDEQIKLADVAKDYKDKHKKAKEDITELEKKTNAGKATEGLAEAKRRITAAENAATGKDWKGAVKAIEQAKVSIESATKLLGDDKELSDLKDTGKLDAIDKDFNAAFGVYQAMRSKVAAKDTGGVFATRLATADAPAQRARDAAGLTPANFVQVRSELDAAIAICEATLLLVAKKGPYDSALATLKNDHSTRLPALNEDNCLRQKLREIDQAITEAENLAKAETYNFDGAQQAIGGGMLKVREAERTSEAFKAMKPDKEKIKEAITFLKASARAAGVTAELKRLTDAETSINTDIRAGKVPDAAKTAAAAAKLCPGLKLVGQQYEEAVEFRKQVRAMMPDIEAPGKEACAAQLAEANKWFDEMQKLFDDHIYGSVLGAAQKVYQAIQAGKTILAGAQQYEPARAQAETKLTSALPNRNAATEERYAALRARYDAAVKLVTTERNYPRAKNMVETIPTDCDNLAADAQKFRDYEASLAKAKQKLEEAKKSKHASILPLLAHLTARYDTANKIAKGGDYAEAKKLLDDIFTGAGAAVTAGEEAANYVAAAKDLKKPGTPIIDAIAKAKQLYKDLKEKPEALYAMATLRGINQKIEAAEKEALTDEELARDSLVEIVDACAKARIAMGHYTQMEAEMKSLTQEIETLLPNLTKAPFVKEKVEKLLEDIEAARREARGTGQHAKAAKQIATVASALITLRRAADAHALYVKRRGQVEPRLEKMEKHENRYAIVAEIASFRKDLASAAKAAEYDNKAAMALLEKAADTARDALLKAKMHGDHTPKVAEIKKILAGKDGAKRLDAIVATLDPKAKRKVLDVAFEARFDCKLTRFATKQKETDLETWLENNPNATALEKKLKEDFYRDQNKDEKAPDVRRFYDLMCALPETHTKDNDSIQVFVQVGTPNQLGSDYTGGTERRVAMREGDVGASREYKVSMKHEIDEVEEGCETEEGEPISAFNWNTVHEVGHAVDDKLGFMKSRGNGLAGWNEYGSNVRPIAVAVAGKYKFDVAYVAAYMANSSDIAVPEPKDCDAEEWERRRVACIAWVDSARAGKNPWSSASTAKALAIGGVVYQESYKDGRWSSYNLAARKQGVTGYQFRAPGEWFSELYAAYHTQKLKPSHPACSWLQSL